MAIDERARHQLFTRLEEVLGPEAATTLMSHLPPVGWADVATKRDLDQLAPRIDAVEQRVTIKLEALKHELRPSGNSFGLVRGSVLAARERSYPQFSGSFRRS